ncbi:protein FAR1-RELATED SEQUENCE 5-like [Helianthus annuus]|uniref:protein FAR1-RELATED SEQUENCE 5-like n=1 Tax=Helianthus annuus TaxID=4232 RepID=UPI000B8F9684|nr:protein FAR1-RELATED SEQUENCE 5-like [Helianthus annuus]
MSSSNSADNISKWEERVCINSGRKFFKPKVSGSITPAVGMFFKSFDEAFAFYQRYALAAGFSARKNTSWKNGDGLVRIRYIVCSKEGFHVSKEIDSGSVENSKKIVRRNRGSKRVGCNAHVKLILENNNMYKIYYFEEEHNHIFVEDEDIHFLPAARSIDYVKESFISGLSAINIGPVKAFNIMKTMYGGFGEVGASKVDCKNYRRDLNLYIGEYDAEMVVRRLIRKKECCPGFTCDYVIGEDRRLKGLFWADEQSKKNYTVFGDIFGFDATYKSNKYDLVFVPFTGIDNHYRNVTFGGALLGSETADSYRWLLRCFVNAFGSEPKVVVTDQDAAMKRAIKDVLSRSRHRLCMWHIWEKLKTKVGPVLSANTDFNTRMTHVVWNDTISPEDFETEWHSIMSTFGLENHEWLKDMYDLRFDWIPAYYHGEDLAGLMRTTSRCESENYFFGQICNPRCTLVEFFTHFETAMDIQRHEHRRNDHDTRYIESKPWSDFVLEKQASEIYTKTIFKDIQIEIDAAITKCMSKSLDIVGDVQYFEIKDFRQPCTSFLKVQYSKQEDGLTISCSCKRFEQFGILCRHIFYVLRYDDINEFPRRYVHRRWMRDVVSVGSNHSNIRFDEIGRNSEIDKVYREIVVANEYVVNRLVGDIDELCRYRDHIKSYIDKADEVMVAAPPPSRKERFAEIGGNIEKSDSIIRVPIKTRTKGCGVQKRIKSNREIAIQKSSKIQKSCRVCGEKGHNSRTCKDKVSSNAIGSSNAM